MRAIEPVQADVIDGLKESCNRYTNGECTTRRCLVRGGWESGPPDYSTATCEDHETIQALSGIEGILEALTFSDKALRSHFIGRGTAGGSCSICNSKWYGDDEVHVGHCLLDLNRQALAPYRKALQAETGGGG